MLSDQANLCTKPGTNTAFMSAYFRTWMLKGLRNKTYTISAALSALTACDVPIWNTTLPLSCGHVRKTTLSVPFSTKSVVPRDSGKQFAR
jgi:hypothetical protein